MAKSANPDLCSYGFYRMQNDKHQVQQQQKQQQQHAHIYVSHVVNLIFGVVQAALLHETKENWAENRS